jgi:Zn-finger nucleic acid-binding protein
MRWFDRRLVCDRCEGMFIEIDDFADAIKATDPIDLHDEGPAARSCPCCQQSMRACQLVIGKVEFDEVIPYCPDHGLWFGDGSLIDVLARIERSHHRGSGGSPAQSVTSLYTLLRNPRRKTQRTPPVSISAHRHRYLSCPVCEGELVLLLDRWACGHCAGTFVENHALEAMVSEMKSTPWQLPTVAGQPGTLSCPVCADAMHVEQLERVSVDRCGEHGVWFDPLSLGAALHQASNVHQRRPIDSVAAWLRRMF